MTAHVEHLVLRWRRLSQRLNPATCSALFETLCTDDFQCERFRWRSIVAPDSMPDHSRYAIHPQRVSISYCDSDALVRTRVVRLPDRQEDRTGKDMESGVVAIVSKKMLPVPTRASRRQS